MSLPDEGKRELSDKPCDAVQARRDGSQELEAIERLREACICGQRMSFLMMDYWNRTSPRNCISEHNFDPEVNLTGLQTVFIG